MSRSYKKTPVHKQKAWLTKKNASKILRSRMKSMKEPDNFRGKGHYKRCVNTYYMLEYVSYRSCYGARERYRCNPHLSRRYPTEDDYLMDVWEKYYFRK